jgi:hypothetical protein
MRGVSRVLKLLVEIGGWPDVMRKVVAQMREHVKSVSLIVQEAHVISGVDADSVVGSEEAENEDEAGGVAAGRRVVVSRCAGERARGGVGGGGEIY